MKRLIPLLSLAFLAILTVFAQGQWQAQPQTDARVEPIYPVNPSYNFHSTSNYSPYQFDWYNGRWNYLPIPYESPSWQLSEPAPGPGHGTAPYMPYGGQSPYPSQQAANSAPANTNVPNVTPQPKPDDTELWSSPTTRPGPAVAPQIVKFEGRIVAIKAVNLAGEANPHILLRLLNDAGATGTIDAGQRLVFPDAPIDPAAKGRITVTGQLGVLDGHLLLFADHIAFGSQMIGIDRPGMPPK